MDRYRDAEGGSGGRSSRTGSRWSSSGDGSPTQGKQRMYRGGQAGGASGPGGGSGSGRFHPYRVGGHHEYPPHGGGYRGDVGGDAAALDEFEPPRQIPLQGQELRRDAGGFDEFGAPRHMPDPGVESRRGFPNRGDTPDHDGRANAVKLFVGSVPRMANEEDIRPLFEPHGNVIEVALIRDRKTGEQQGCCFVKYATQEEADRAIRAVHNQYTLPGGIGPVQVRYADGERERHGTIENKLFVASLNRQATPMEIEQIFSPYGHVEDVYIMRDGMKQSRGCGFVKFSTREMAVAAMSALNGIYVMRGCEQPLVVRFAEPKKPRTGESRGGAGPAFGGPGLSPRSDATLVIRTTGSFDDPKGQPVPSDTWRPPNFQSQGSSRFDNTLGSDKLPSSEGISMAASSDMAGGFRPNISAPNGSQPNYATMPLPAMGANPSMMQFRPVAGQQISQLQKTHVPPQNFSTVQPSQLSNQQTQHGLSQAQGLQVPSQQALSTAQQQGVPGANNQHLLSTNSSFQMLQQPSHQVQQQSPHFLLQQQAEALQSSYQSSQQAILQLQQQVQLMQQQSGQKQQQVNQESKQQQTASGVAAGTAMPATTTANTQQHNTSAVSLSCNWTEHTSPEGFFYYYNRVTQESKWEKPEEFALFEQQQKLLMLQQQQKLSQQFQPPSHGQPLAQSQQAQQVLQTQGIPQMQMRPQDMNFNNLQVLSASVDSAHVQQGIQAAQEWAWKNKTSGS